MPIRKRQWLQAVPVLMASMLLAVASHAAQPDLPRASPESEGFSPDRLARIDQFYQDKVEHGQLPGIVTLVARHGRIVHLSAIGYSDTATRQPLRADAQFRLYSMTKPIAATALMTLYEEGRFQLDDPISKYLPEFKGIRVLRTPDSALTDTVAAVREPTIHDLFRHTAGFKHSSDAYDRADLFGLDVPLVEEMQRLARLPLYFQPGTRFEYSIGQDVQARLVEVLSGMPFDRFLQTRLFAPLNMKDTGYRVSDASRLAAVHWWKDGQLVPLDDVHGHPPGHGPSRGWSDINTYARVRRQTAGSTGLVSTASDYWRFAQMMLDGGVLAGKRILSPSTVKSMSSDHLAPVKIAGASGPDSGVGWGLGFAVLNDPALAGVEAPKGSYYWSGTAETTFWIDPANDIVVVAMTQVLGVPDSDIRGQMTAMVYGALVR